MTKEKIIDKSHSWKNWLIKKLLSSNSTKEEILNYIASESEETRVEEINDNNEKKYIKIRGKKC